MHIELIFQPNMIEILPNWYKHLFSFNLIKYATINISSKFEDCKSVIGYYFLMARAILSKCGQKLQTVSASKTEAKYIALG